MSDFVEGVWDDLEFYVAIALTASTVIFASMLFVSYFAGGSLHVYTTRLGWLEVLGDWAAVVLCLFLAGALYVKRRNGYV